MQVGVKVGILGLNLAYALTFESLYELVVNQFHTLAQYLWVVGLGAIGNGTLHIIEYRQNGRDNLLATVQNQLGTLFQCALAVILKFGSLVEQLSLQLLYFLLGFCQRVNLFFFLSSLVGSSLLILGCLCCLFFSVFNGSLVQVLLVFDVDIFFFHNSIV